MYTYTYNIYIYILYILSYHNHNSRKEMYQWPHRRILCASNKKQTIYIYRYIIYTYAYIHILALKKHKIWMIYNISQLIFQRQSLISPGVHTSRYSTIILGFTTQSLTVSVQRSCSAGVSMFNITSKWSKWSFESESTVRFRLQTKPRLWKHWDMISVHLKETFVIFVISGRHLLSKSYCRRRSVS